MRLALVGMLLAAAGVAAPQVHACAPAPRPGESVSVTLEEALIVWDAGARREHFIRRADFETSAASDFGFLVPTPTRPELAEADDDVFVRLRAAIQPEYRLEQRWRVQPTALVLLPFMFFTHGVDTGAPPMLTTAAPPVRVLEQKRVAGFDAAVLQATDTQALARWLESHGYAWRPALAAWIAPYVERGFTLSAFKIAPSEPGKHVRTPALRMTFETDAPFFPYREPADTPSRAGAFRAFVVAAGRMAPRLAADAAHAGLPWAAKTPFSRPIPAAASLLAGTLPSAPGAGLWLTAFEDTSSKRTNADLWFTPSVDKAEIVPPPVISYLDSVIPLPLDVIAGLAFLVVWLVRRMRRGTRA